MAFQDVTFLPSQASFCCIFLKDFGRDEGLRSATYFKAVDGVSI